MTVTPRPSQGQFALWEPGELRLVGPDARADEPGDDEVIGEVQALEVLQDGEFLPAEGMKYEGGQRLRLLVALHAGMARARRRPDLAFAFLRRAGAPPARQLAAKRSLTRGIWCGACGQTAAPALEHGTVTLGFLRPTAAAARL